VTTDLENSRLRKKILRMETFLDLDKFGKEDRVSKEDMATYYKLTDIPFQKYHSKYGFMHFHVSKSGKFSPEDAFYQPDTVSQFIKPSSKVLELGFGKCPNIFYLAKKHPNATFVGVDLGTLHPKNTLPNVELFHQDYRDLSNFADNSFDVVYGIETICCCPDKEPVCREVQRVLKPGGQFVVYDYSTPDQFFSYDPTIQRGIALFTRAGTGALIESEEDWEQHFAKNGFKKYSITDLSKELLPDLKRLENLSMRVMSSKTKAKVMFATLPDLLMGNVIIGYIGYDCFNEGFITYREWIYTK